MNQNKSELDIISEDKLDNFIKEFVNLDLLNGMQCGILWEEMQEPTVSALGHSYEQSALIQWLTTNNKEPATNEILPYKTVRANQNLKKAIQDFKEKQAELKKNLLEKQKKLCGCRTKEKQNLSMVNSLKDEINRLQSFATIDGDSKEVKQRFPDRELLRQALPVLKKMEEELWLNERADSWDNPFIFTPASLQDEKTQKNTSSLNLENIEISLYGESTTKVLTKEVKSVLEGFSCHLSQVCMQDPVVLEDEQTYEKKAIQQWFSQGNNTSPFTKKPVNTHILTPNHNLKQSINHYSEFIRRYNFIINLQDKQLFECNKNIEILDKNIVKLLLTAGEIAIESGLLSEAIHFLTPLARNGHPIPCYLLSKLYSHSGQMQLSEEYYKKAKLHAYLLNSQAEKNDSLAQRFIAFFYMEGLGVEKNWSRGFDFLNQAAKNGEKQAAYLLANYYLKQWKFDIKNYQSDNKKILALKWFEVAAFSGCNKSALALANLKQDLAVKEHWFKISAQGNNRVASFLLACLYWDKDLEKALRLLCFSAKQNNVFAQLALILCGIAQFTDYPISSQPIYESLLQTIALQNDVNAQFYLGYYYSFVRPDSFYSKVMTIRWLSLGAEQNHLKSLYYLGKLLLPTFPKMGVHYIKQAAEQGFLQAQIELADELELQDSKEAVKWRLYVSNQGHSESQKKIVHQFWNGQIAKTVVDIVDIIQWSAQAAHEDRTISYYLASYYAKFNIKKGIFYYEIAANAGHPEAAMEAGYYYYESKEVKQDAKRACHYYKLAAEAGHTIGQHKFAEFLFRGIGTQKNTQSAVLWFIKAAESKYSHSELALARIYNESVLSAGIVKDYSKASQYYHLAAAHGEFEAQQYLAQCYENGWLGLEINHEQALEYYRLADKSNDPFSKCKIAFYHEMALGGLNQNIPIAFSIYEEMAMQDYYLGQYYLGLCYKNGRGTHKNGFKALNYFAMSALQKHSPALQEHHLTLQLLVKAQSEENFTDHKQIQILLEQLVTENNIADAWGQCLLANCYQYGFGVPQSQMLANFWYYKAALVGHADAAFYLALSQETLSMKIYWFTKAAEGKHLLAFRELQALNSVEIKESKKTVKMNFTQEGYPLPQWVALTQNNWMKPILLREMLKIDGYLLPPILEAAATADNKLLEREISWRQEYIKDVMENNFFHYAAANNNIEVFRKHASNYPHLASAQNRRGNTVLHWAISYGYLDLVIEIVTRKIVSPDIENNLGYTAILWAVKNNQLPILQYLLQRQPQNVNQKLKKRLYFKKIKSEQSGMTPLLLASALGNLRLVRWLLESANASINECTFDGYTSLLLAVGGDFLDIVQYLVKVWLAPINQKTYRGITPLAFSIRNGHLEMTRYLLEQQQSISNKYDNPDDLINMALHYGQKVILKMLIWEWGFYPNFQDHKHLNIFVKRESYFTSKKFAWDQQFIPILENEFKYFNKTKDIEYKNNLKNRCAQWDEIIKNHQQKYILYLTGVRRPEIIAVITEALNAFSGSIMPRILVDEIIDYLSDIFDNLMIKISHSNNALIRPLERFSTFNFFNQEKIIAGQLLDNIKWLKHCNVFTIRRYVYHFIMKHQKQLEGTELHGILLNLVGEPFHLPIYFSEKKDSNKYGKFFEDQPYLMKDFKSWKVLFKEELKNYDYLDKVSKNKISQKIMLYCNWSLSNKKIILNELGVNINEPETTFHAAFLGDDKLLRQKIDDQKICIDSDENHFVHYAAANGHLQIVEEYVSADSKLLFKRNLKRETMVLMAAKNGHIKVVESLLIQKKSDDKDEKGNTVMLCAAEHGHLTLIQLLVTQFKAELTEKNDQDETALLIAARQGYVLIVLWLLLKTDIDRSHRNIYNHGILECAIANGHIKLAQELVSRFGIKPSSLDPTIPQLKKSYDRNFDSYRELFNHESSEILDNFDQKLCVIRKKMLKRLFAFVNDSFKIGRTEIEHKLATELMAGFNRGNPTNILEIQKIIQQFIEDHQIALTGGVLMPILIDILQFSCKDNLHALYNHSLIFSSHKNSNSQVVNVQKSLNSISCEQRLT